jgi:probable O-glycosylation ligase (exosortase A-associated)
MLRTIFVSAILIIGGILALRSAFNALLLYLWIGYFRPEQWVWTKFFMNQPISFVAGIFLIFRSLISGIPLRFDLRVACLIVMLVLGGISTFTSEHIAFSLPYYQDWATTLVVSYLIFVLASDVKHLRWIFLAIGISLGAEATKQGWVQLIFHPGGTNLNEHPALGDNNGVAVGMLMLVPILIALARTSATKPERWLHSFIAIGVMYRAIASYSRGGFLAAGALGIVYAWRSPYKFRALIGGVVVATVILSAMPQSFWDRMSTITVEQDPNQRDSSAVSRLHFWRVAIEMTKDKPFFGVGLNAFQPAYSTYDFSKGAFGNRRSVHSAWLGLLSELGIPAFVVFVTTIFLAFKACWRARRLARDGLISSELGHFAVALETGLIAFSIGASFVIFAYVEMLWHFIALSMAVNHLTREELAARAKKAAVPPAPPQPPRSALPQLPRVPRPVRVGAARSAAALPVRRRG